MTKTIVCPNLYELLHYQSLNYMSGRLWLSNGDLQNDPLSFPGRFKRSFQNADNDQVVLQ